jgi:CHAT domain-containing protein
VVLAGADADLAHLRGSAAKGPYRYVHFATHGVFNETRPQYSGLVLGPGEGDDGFLTTAEVFTLELDCDQVVLSACSSALGEQVTGEGLVGLTRGFLFAGARSVVAALWDVSGASTAAFMREFYGLLAGGGDNDRAGALAEVKRRLLLEGSEDSGRQGTICHPYFWAAFVLNGEGFDNGR